MRTVHILAPDVGGGVKNFCLDFSQRLSGYFFAKTHFYEIDFEKFESTGLEIGGSSRSQDQAQHIWDTINLQPSDVILCNDGRELIWIGASGVANTVIYVMHGDNASYYDALSLNGHLCDLIVCVNPGVQAKLQSTVPAERLFYLQQIFTPSRKALDELVIAKSKNSRSRVAFIGRAHYQKGFDVLLKAIELHPNCLFDVILSGEAPSKDVFSKCSNVEVFTNIQHSQVIEVLESADHLFFPSRKEGLPLSVLEALSSGCSVSCFDLTGFDKAFSGCQAVRLCRSDSEILESLPGMARAEMVKQAKEFSERWTKQADRTFTELIEMTTAFELGIRVKKTYSNVDLLPKFLAATLFAGRRFFSGRR